MDLEYIAIFKIQMPAIVINDFAIKVQTMSFSNFKKKKKGEKKEYTFSFLLPARNWLYKVFARLHDGMGAGSVVFGATIALLGQLSQAEAVKNFLLRNGFWILLAIVF